MKVRLVKIDETESWERLPDPTVKIMAVYAYDPEAAHYYCSAEKLRFMCWVRFQAENGADDAAMHEHIDNLLQASSGGDDYMNASFVDALPGKEVEIETIEEAIEEENANWSM